jgi:hypothetical protein
VTVRGRDDLEQSILLLLIVLLLPTTYETPFKPIMPET